MLHLSEHYGDSVPGVEETPWRTRELSVKDPFGNRLVFSQDLAAGPASP